MQSIAQTRRVATAVVLVSALFALTLSTPVSAQLAPPDRNAVIFRVATFGNPVYTAGFSWAFNPQFDIAGSYNFTANAPTGNMWDAGVRYHFRLPTSGVDAYVGAGVANVSAPFMGFANGSGFTGGGGGSVRFNELLTGYGSVNIVSVGGTTNSVLDLGVELNFGTRASGQLGYINFGGVGEPYLGVSFALH
ncbi:MAG TPA: hypothetical protein VHM88_03985 [Candidatus Acidoferrales bacterium]|jgi:hypothetical protein|nr:hypothetical protein [Candidatus Acidoferrales bacterium]